MTRAPMRFAALILLSVVVVSSASGRVDGEVQTPSASPAAVTFVISGRGWGHGVGLAQYGALGYAKRGVTYDRILAHYYRGTALGPAHVTRVRVLLVEKRKKLEVGSQSGFRVRDGSGLVQTLAGTVRVSAGEAAVTLTVEDAEKQLPSPLTFLRGTSPLQLDGRPYRGSLEIGLAGKRLQAIDIVGIDQYLYGVVTNEMPHDWPLEALKAQAVAARSYALAHRLGGSVNFDLFADVRSQVYGGIATETPSARAAVKGTAREVLLYDGKVADTFFFSSSGGRTADATEVWGMKSIPYLVSVPDPHDTISPYHRWGPVTFTAAKAGKALAVGGLQDLIPEVGPSGRARTVAATGVLGESEITGSVFRRALELRSTWLTIGRLALDRPSSPAASGAQVRLTGGIRGLKGVVLEQRPVGSTWQAGSAVKPSSDGRFVVTMTPLQTTDFRLRSGLSTGQSVRVVVEPA